MDYGLFSSLNSPLSFVAGRMGLGVVFAFLEASPSSELSSPESEKHVIAQANNDKDRNNCKTKKT